MDKECGQFSNKTHMKKMFIFPSNYTPWGCFCLSNRKAFKIKYNTQYYGGCDKAYSEEWKFVHLSEIPTVSFQKEFLKCSCPFP